MSKIHPPFSPVRALCPSVHSPAHQYSHPLASGLLSLHELPDFICQIFISQMSCQYQQLSSGSSSSSSLPSSSLHLCLGFPLPVRYPSPACCHSELNFKRCSRPWTGQWFSVPLEQETTWHTYQNPAVPAEGLWGCPGHITGTRRSLAGLAGTDPGTVLCVLQHC